MVETGRAGPRPGQPHSTEPVLTDQHFTENSAPKAEAARPPAVLHAGAHPRAGTHAMHPAPRAVEQHSPVRPPSNPDPAHSASATAGTIAVKGTDMTSYRGAGTSANRAPRRPGSNHPVRAYLLLVALPIAAAAALALGITHRLAARSTGALAALAGTESIDRVLTAVTAVAALAAGAGAVARLLGQPAVVGELVGGVLLGPTALGALAPGFQHWLFPASAMPSLNTLAQLGVILFMFLIGTELAPGALRRGGTRALVIGHASMAPALLFGVLAAWALRSRFPSPQSGNLPFLLFIALCFAITAFPVLARVLTEQGLIRTRIGGIGIAAAGIGDITAWCLLALVVAAVAADVIAGRSGRGSRPCGRLRSGDGHGRTASGGPLTDHPGRTRPRRREPAPEPPFRRSWCAWCSPAG